jgi:6-pyruvoyltetrahydropterin/6-carboxytetrahydropterin synthase
MNEAGLTCWVWKRHKFDAAHYLPNYEGPCQRMHGHTYFVELGVRCEIDPKTGMGIDLREVGEFLKSNVEALFDHQIINERLPKERVASDLFTVEEREIPSTAENIASYILEVALRYFKDKDLKVRVYEGPDSWVEIEA